MARIVRFLRVRQAVRGGPAVRGERAEVSHPEGRPSTVAGGSLTRGMQMPCEVGPFSLLRVRCANKLA